MTVELPDLLKERKIGTDATFTSLQTSVARSEAPSLVGEGAAVYVTGSYARGEASRFSDLDAFTLFDPSWGAPTWEEEMKAVLERATLAEDIPPFTDEGAYLRPHAISDLVVELGSSKDDYQNIFTARMLLLLESRCLIGTQLYDRAIQDVISEYWRDYGDNSEEFLPVYLTNDIIRYWKVLCLNYEARTRDREIGKRHLHNYKLKHSRLLTCYSAILWLGAIYRMQSTVRPEDARRMASLSPIERLMAIPGMLGLGVSARTTGLIQEMLERYTGFLRETDAPKEQLRERFSDPKFYADRKVEAREFGSNVFELIRDVVEPTALFRFLVV